MALIRATGASFYHHRTHGTAFAHTGLSRHENFLPKKHQNTCRRRGLGTPLQQRQAKQVGDAHSDAEVRYHAARREARMLRAHCTPCTAQLTCRSFGVRAIHSDSRRSACAAKARDISGDQASDAARGCCHRVAGRSCHRRRRKRIHNVTARVSSVQGIEATAIDS